MRGAAVAAGLVVALAAGVWVLGARVAGGYASAIALATGWFVAVGGLVVWLCVRDASLRRIVGGTFAVVAAVSLFGFWFTTIRETEVDERLEPGVPVSRLPAAERPDVEDLLAPQP